MDSLFTENILDEADDISHINSRVWILGEEYNTVQGLIDNQSVDGFDDVDCFIPIGDCSSTFTSDKGWGCMLRCGQMVLAQALIRLHLGTDWRWIPETKNKTYLKILKCFEDKKAAPFSIHQIALMGASEGKEVGQWFGPNTIAQVLKKLVVYDEWSSLIVHVALDNTLITKDIERQCKIEGGGTPDADGKIPLEAPGQWKPLLLLIPLRLGISKINPVYINGFKTAFKIPQSVGVIGGKPNLALYFIGCVEDEVIYLDPHTTQRSGSVQNKTNEEEIEMDDTYHCKSASRIPITDMDPSVALCFFCSTQVEFWRLVQSLAEELILPEYHPLFEVRAERLGHRSGTEDASASEAVSTSSFVDFEHVERQFDTSDEDFELLG